MLIKFCLFNIYFIRYLNSELSYYVLNEIIFKNILLLYLNFLLNLYLVKTIKKYMKKIKR